MGFEGFKVDPEGNARDVREEREKAEKESKKPEWRRVLEKLTGKEIDKDLSEEELAERERKLKEFERGHNL